MFHILTNQHINRSISSDLHCAHWCFSVMGMYTAHPAPERTHEQGGSRRRRRGTPVTEIQGKVAEPSTVPRLVGEGVISETCLLLPMWQLELRTSLVCEVCSSYIPVCSGNFHWQMLCSLLHTNEYVCLDTANQPIVHTHWSPFDRGSRFLGRGRDPWITKYLRHLCVHGKSAPGSDGGIFKIEGRKQERKFERKQTHVSNTFIIPTSLVFKAISSFLIPAAWEGLKAPHACLNWIGRKESVGNVIAEKNPK